MKRAILSAAIGGLLLLPLTVGADESPAPTSEVGPTTRSSPLMGRRDAARVREHLGTYKPGDAGYTDPITSQDREAIDKFMKANSPKRWEKYQDVPEDRKERISRLIRAQMRALQKLKNDDPALYDVRMKRLPIEDDMFALNWQLRHDDAKNADELKKALREKVRQFVDSSLHERRLRLERQQKRLQDQQDIVNAESSKLKELTETRDQIVDKGVQDGPDALRDLATPAARKPRESTQSATQPSADSGDQTP